MSNSSRCHCGNPSVCYEVKGLTRNRGRWYWKCATNACDYFTWDNSALPFITHPYEAYNTQPQLEIEFAKRRRFAINSRRQNLRTTNETPIPKVKVSFSILSKEEIGIEIQGSQNHTIEPVISSLPEVVFNPVINQFVIPATNLTFYQRAVRAVPVNLRNIEVELDLIPPAVLETLFLTEHQREIDDVQTRWTNFVENGGYSKMEEEEYQRQGVRKGLELNGRVILSNYTGLNGIPVAFSLLKLYKEEWPVLLMCPKSMCLTWRFRIMEYFGLTKKQVIVADYKYLEAESRRADKRMRMMDPNRPRQQEEEEEDDDDEEDERVKFVIIEFERAYRHDILVMDQGFKIVLMDNSDSLRFRMLSRTGKIAKLLQSHKRVILLSEMSYRAVPVELFSQISVVQKNLFPDFDAFAKRYCDAKQEVFGWRYDGRSQANEFRFIMDKVIWHAPPISKTSIKLRNIYRHQIQCNILIKHRDGFEKDLKKLMDDDYFEEDEAHEKQEIIENMYEDTGKAKIEFMNNYIRHIFDSHWKQNIAIFYHHKSVVTEIEKQLKSAKTLTDYIHIDNQEGLQSKMNQFMRERTTRVLLVDMNLENLKLVYSVDLVIMAEIPLEKEHVDRIESVFKVENRKWPLSIRYLHAPGSLDEYLWKDHFGSDSII